MAKNSSATANSQVDKTAPSAQAAKTSISPEKKKALDAIMQKIEKDHGKGAIMRLGDATQKVALSKFTGQKAQAKPL